jgi:hypothetical protein
MPVPSREPSSPMQPLSVGNVVSAGLRLYRSHFKQYLGLAFQAVLWAIIPIYGWAKAWMINAVICRLAFGEMINQPEGIQGARNQLKPKLWQFLVVQLLVGLLLFGVNFGLSLGQGLIISLFNSVFGQNSPVTSLFSIILSLVVLFIYIWFYSRVLIPEVSLAVEENVDGASAISRSWSLTQGHVLRLQGVVLIASLITLPIIGIALIPMLAAISYLITIAITSGGATPSVEALGFFFLMLLVSLVLFLLASVIVTPFWQAIKAVIYYDLKSRREGLGLTLRDRDTLI